MVTVLYIPDVCIFKMVYFFEAITAEHLRLSSLRSAFAFETWAHMVGLKKNIVEANKIMKLSFFIITI